MTDKDLERQIEKQLVREPGLTARQLGAILGVYKGDVNSCLYGSRKFVRDDSPRPCWSLKNPKAAGPIDLPEHETISKVREAPASPKARDFDFSTLRPWQTAALESWNKNKRKGLVEAVTGTGKTRLAIAAIAEELQLGGKVAVIVPTVELQRQWFEELDSHFMDIQIGLLGNGNQDELTSCDVLVAIVHSASRYDLGLQDDELGLLVADECHRYGAETFSRALEDGFRSRLGLTATRSDRTEPTGSSSSTLEASSIHWATRKPFDRSTSRTSKLLKSVFISMVLNVKNSMTSQRGFSRHKMNYLRDFASAPKIISNSSKK